jgi:hypothetical protein
MGLLLQMLILVHLFGIYFVDGRSNAFFKILAVIYSGTDKADNHIPGRELVLVLIWPNEVLRSLFRHLSKLSFFCFFKVEFCHADHSGLAI